MSQLHVSTHPLVQHKLALLRNQKTEPKKFREVVRELAILMIAEATADLPTIEVQVTTPMGMATCRTLRDNLEMLPYAEVWHIGLYRDERTLRPVEYYNKLPVNPTVQVCLVLDPMLATGGSATATVSILKRWGAQQIKFIGLIGAPEGVARLHAEHPDVPIHLAALDERLNEIGYIVPGLGDAGDRQFGTA